METIKNTMKTCTIFENFLVLFLYLLCDKFLE